MRLTEDQAKEWLANAGLPVPRGFVAASVDAAVRAAHQVNGGVMVKALVPTNRRKLSGGILGPVQGEDVRDAARRLLGRSVAGFLCKKVYVEEAVTSLSELYLSFSFSAGKPMVSVSPTGGIHIEQTATPGHGLTSQLIDPTTGLGVPEADALWATAGIKDTIRSPVVDLTVAAGQIFENDAITLELNPITVTDNGAVVAVGALVEMDDAALFRHPEFDWSETGLTEREARVAEANHRLPGASVRYTELDGDVGLFVGGGGAGLYQHDLLIAEGVAPANHSDMGAGAPAEKLDVLIEAILSHPKLRSLLVGFNELQMAHCDLVMERLMLALNRMGFRQGELPVVVRLNGLGAERARELATGWQSLTYLPPEATLADGVRTIAETG